MFCDIGNYKTYFFLYYSIFIFCFINFIQFFASVQMPFFFLKPFSLFINFEDGVTRSLENIQQITDNRYLIHVFSEAPPIIGINFDHF